MDQRWDSYLFSNIMWPLVIGPETSLLTCTVGHHKTVLNKGGKSSKQQSQRKQSLPGVSF